MLIPAHAVVFVPFAAEQLDDLSASSWLTVQPARLDPVAYVCVARCGCVVRGHPVTSLAHLTSPREASHLGQALTACGDLLSRLVGGDSLAHRAGRSSSGIVLCASVSDTTHGRLSPSAESERGRENAGGQLGKRGRRSDSQAPVGALVERLPEPGRRADGPTG